MGIKIEPIEEEKKFKPFKITLDIENETQANLIYAVLNAGKDSRINLLNQFGMSDSFLPFKNGQKGFPYDDYNEFDDYIKSMLK